MTYLGFMGLIFLVLAIIFAVVEPQQGLFITSYSMLIFSAIHGVGDIVVSEIQKSLPAQPSNKSSTIPRRGR